MSNRVEREAEDQYERQNDPSPVSGTVRDDSYATRRGPMGGPQGAGMPVQKDTDPFEDPMQPGMSNTDEQLGMFQQS